MVRKLQIGALIFIVVCLLVIIVTKDFGLFDFILPALLVYLSPKWIRKDWQKYVINPEKELEARKLKFVQMEREALNIVLKNSQDAFLNQTKLDFTICSNCGNVNPLNVQNCFCCGGLK